MTATLAFVLALVLVPCVLGGRITGPVEENDALAMFEEFIQTHGKVYELDEKQLRFNIFKQNLVRIAALNNAQSTATYGITNLADLTQEEYASHFLIDSARLMAGIEGRSRTNEVAFDPSKYDHVPLPTDFDWRNESVITPVKFQRQCGACWAFSVTETVESVNAITHGTLQVLAPQQLVDCTFTPPSGCEGGDTVSAYDYVIAAGGIELEKDYPYVNHDGNCTANRSLVHATISNYTFITYHKNETAMMVALYNMAPLSVCVDANPWQHYTGGIITSDCAADLNHCVQLTGFGTDNNIDYWSVRNSYTDRWGDGGYVRIMRGHDLCGIAKVPSTALMSP